MAGGFGLVAGNVGNGLLGGLNSQYAQQQSDERKQQDYVAQLAAKSSQDAKDKDAQVQRETDAQSKQTEGLAGSAAGSANQDTTPGHIMAAHNFVSSGVDTTKYGPDDWNGVYRNINSQAAGINARLAAKAAEANGQQPLPVPANSMPGYAPPPMPAAFAPSATSPTGIPQVNASALQPPVPMVNNVPTTPDGKALTPADSTGAAPQIKYQGWNYDRLAQLEDKAPGHSAHVAGILTGDLAPPNSNRSVKAYALTDELTSVDPTFSARRFAFKQDLSSDKPSTIGGNMLQIGQAMNHLDLLDHAADAMRNGNIPAANKLANMYAVQTGNPSVTDYNSLVLAVAPEINKVYRPNGGTGEEVDRFINAFNQNGSPQQVHGAIADQFKLIQGRYDQLDQQAKTAMGVVYDKGLLKSRMDENSRTAWDRFDQYRKDQNLPKDTIETQQAQQAAANQAQGQPQQGGNQPPAAQQGQQQPQVPIPKGTPVAQTQEDVTHAPPNVQQMVINGVLMKRSAPPQQQAPQVPMAGGATQ